jgi:hypothetical protein
MGRKVAGGWREGLDGTLWKNKKTCSLRSHLVASSSSLPLQLLVAAALRVLAVVIPPRIIHDAHCNALSGGCASAGRCACLF